MFIKIQKVYFLAAYPRKALIRSFLRILNKSVKDEAIYNLTNGQYYSFLCILALSTIIVTQINSIYPSVGQKKYRLLLNNVINILSVNHVTTPISIMFVRFGIN